MTPQRIQLRRSKGFRLQAHSLALNGLHAVKVDRTTRWGNPYRINRSYDEAKIRRVLEFYERDLRAGVLAVTLEDVQVGLRGVNLACWCKASAPCHADVLLRIANEPVGTERSHAVFQCRTEIAREANNSSGERARALLWAADILGRAMAVDDAEKTGGTGETR